ncbi:MAG TPA: protein tyrosine phosphatase, partial [Cytophagales bacterium]|nr:protein tyrosine phosphatase [Cytophagales bacterium]
MKILFVCLGNICRSPLAEAIFNDKIAKCGLQDSFIADSCGTSNYNIGDWPDPRTIKSANKHQVPISHFARQLTRADLDNFDLILAMDSYNLGDILSMASMETKDKVKLMRSYDPEGEGDVPDPYHGRESDFENVFQILDR